jgi:uncharacterized protein (DUF58 family)
MARAAHLRGGMSGVSRDGVGLFGQEDVRSNRYTVGGQVEVTNTSSRRTLPQLVELPVGDSTAAFNIPTLSPGASIDEVFVVPTERRGVIMVGPATSVRGDPIGLFHRDTASSSALELVVHPRTVPLGPIGSGLLRDLEGLTTKDLSASDLAFHTLRDYSPGDDRRHVHWRSSARHPLGGLFVRQFQDTRRSTLCAIVDGRPDGYADADEFETALEVAASVLLRACRDELPASVIVGEHTAGGTLPHALLDALARAELVDDSTELARQVVRAMSKGADISYAVLVTGSRRTPHDILRAAARFGVEVRVVAVRVAPDNPPTVRTEGRVGLVSLSTLTDLPGLLHIEVAV